MATNPITTEDLTISFSELLKIPVGDRVQAAMLSPDYQNALINSLTPIQMAKAFPDYYRRDLPDISNFVLGNRYLDDKGAAAFNQKGGGDYGEDKPLYDGKRKTSPPPKTVVDTILESAKIYQATGKTGVTSAIKNVNEKKIMSTADVSLSPQERALLDTLAIGNPNETGYWESPSYNTIVGGKEFESFADHPGIFGLGNSSAAGRYQFVGKTWKLVVDKYNKENPDNPITDFSPLNQDRAALWLAKSDYKRRTGGRDLMEDLNNPPENFGELIKTGLGGIGTNTTWEILQKRNAFEIENAFNENLKRNAEYAKQEVEAAAKQDTGIKVTVTPEVSEILSSNPETKKYFLEDNPDVGIKLQEQINAGILSIDDLKIKVKSNTQTIDKLIQTTQEISIDDDVMLGKKPFIEGNDFAVPIYTNAQGGKRFDENLEGLTPQAIERLKQQAIAAKAAGLTKLEISGAQTHEGHASHGAGTETDLIGYNEDGTLWTADQRATTALGAIQLGGANRAGFYGSGRVLHTGMAGEVEQGPKIEAAWGPSGKTAGVSIGEFNPGLERELAAYLKGQGPMPQSEALNLHLQKMQEAKLAEQNKTTATAVPETTSQRLFIGDSIAEGMKDAAKGEGNTQVGRKPSEVLSEMERMGADYFKGKEVVLSTGLSNNTQDLDSVKKQMEFLKNAGAKVKIAGMSNSREDLAPGNQQLQQLSSEYGYDFMGGYEAGEDKVHPTNYGDYLALATPKEEVPTYQYGGKPETQDDENLSVYDDTGSLRFKMNSGEGIYVKPEANEYADSKIDELSNRLDDVSNSFNANQPQQNRPKSDARHPWANKVIAADRPRSPSADRANRRTKFLNEGWRAGGWGSPNSITS